MGQERLRELADRLEAESRPDAELVAATLDALRGAFPRIAPEEAANAELCRSADGALHLVSIALPDWFISLEGEALEPDFHWTCTLRESRVSDDEMVIGIGRAPSLASALLAATLRTAAVQAG